MKNLQKFFLYILITLSILILLPNCKIEQDSPALLSIYTKTQNMRDSYFIGNTFTSDGLEVYAVYNDGSEKMISDYTLSIEDNIILSEEGIITVDVSFSNKKCSFYIFVSQPKILKVYIKSFPKKLAYFVNEKFDLTGLEIEALLEDNSTFTIQDYECNFSQESVLTDIGLNTITLKYNDFSFDFAITVYEKQLLNLYVKKAPTKTVYYTGDKIDFTDLVIEAVFNDNSIEEITNYTLPDNIDLLEKGKKSIEISFLDKKTSFEVNIFDLQIVYINNLGNKENNLYEDITLTTEIKVNGNGLLTFKWYKQDISDSMFNEILQTEPIEIEDGKNYTTSVTIHNNNFINTHYLCEAVLINNNKQINKYSNECIIKQVLDSALPIMYINTKNQKDLINKDDKISSSIDLYDSTGSNISHLENVTFSGRGNSTWWQPKKPYKIKTKQPVSFFNMPEHTQWMLIANYMDMSFMKNETAFFISEQLGMDWTVHGKFINLVKNDEYLGLYWLGEQIKVDQNRINIDNENDFLIELDVYYDEDWKFKSEIKNYPYQIKNDNFMTEERLLFLKEKIDYLESILYEENFPYSDPTHTAYNTVYKDLIDIDSMAQFYIVNEIMFNGELGHPKSCYFKFISNTELLKAGPVWDFDWAAYSDSPGLLLSNTLYYDSLLKTVEFNDALNTQLQKLTTVDLSQRFNELTSEISDTIILDTIRWGANNRNPVGKAQESWIDYVNDLEHCTTSRLLFMKDRFFQTSYDLL